MVENLVLGRGSLFFSPYPRRGALLPGPRGYFGNTPQINITENVTKLDHYSMRNGVKVKDRSINLQEDLMLAFETDDINLGNLALWFSGTTVGVLPTDAPTDLGNIVMIGKNNAIFGSLYYFSDNPVGDNTNYWFPYVNLTPTGNFALKGDTWQTLSFQAEALKRDATTERVYMFQGAGGASLADAAGTTYIDPSMVAVANGGIATGGTIMAPGTVVHGNNVPVVYTLTGGDLGYLFLNNGTVNVGSPVVALGATGTVGVNVPNTGTFTVKLHEQADGLDAIFATTGSIVSS